MTAHKNNTQIISAASILGLKSTGVEKLAETFLHARLAEKIGSHLPVTKVSLFNDLYSNVRNRETNCLNTESIIDFSANLIAAVGKTLDEKHFAFVLGGDCSILLGIMPALKKKGNYGLIFIDAHADFYLPRQSPTGEVADMDLAIVTGRGPEALTNIQGMKPYVDERNVIHVGQRDAEEVRQYKGTSLADTPITCFDLATIRQESMRKVTAEIVNVISKSDVDGYWIHFDTDSLSDGINPAVDYRLPGGLQFEEIRHLLQELLGTSKMFGISLTIFNPTLDKDGSIAADIIHCLDEAFNFVK